MEEQLTHLRQAGEDERIAQAAVMRSDAELLRAQAAIRDQAANRLHPSSSKLPAAEAPSVVRTPSFRSTVITLYVDGDKPTFNEARFKKSLAGLLMANIVPQQITITPLKKRGGARAAQIKAGSCDCLLYTSPSPRD